MPMRNVIALAILVLAASVQTANAEKEGPWCSQVTIGEGDFATRCHHQTFDSCRRDIAGMGASFCVPNVNYKVKGPNAPIAREKKQPPTR
jgi:hypothetical protein